MKFINDLRVHTSILANAMSGIKIRPYWPHTIQYHFHLNVIQLDLEFADEGPYKTAMESYPGPQAQQARILTKRSHSCFKDDNFRKC